MEKFGIQLFSLSYTLAQIAHHQHFQTDSGFQHKTLNKLYKDAVTGMDDLLEQVLGKYGKALLNKDVIIYDVNQYKGLNGVLKLLSEIITILRGMPCETADILAMRDNFVTDLNKAQFLLKSYS